MMEVKITKSHAYLDRALHFLLIASVITIFIGGPNVSVGPMDLRAFDGVFLLLVFCGSVWLLDDHNTKISLPDLPVFWGLVLVYLCLAFFLPLLGLVIYNYPIAYIVGDLRWIQILGVAVFILLYHEGITDTFHSLVLSMKVILFLNIFFIIIQYLHWDGLIDTSIILEIWYSGTSAASDYGYHIGRFSGAHTQISTLGLVSTVCIAVFATTYVRSQEGIVPLLFSILALIASGTRTAMIASIGVFCLCILTYLLKNGIKTPSPIRMAASLIILPLLLSFMYYFNIGRIRTSDRYFEFIDILLGGGIAEISGRADRWEPALQEVEAYTIGTLANPAWVFDHLSAIDSYFVLTYLQGGIVFLVAYLLLLTIIALHSVRLLVHDIHALIPLSFIGIIATHSLMQNFMTSLSGKFILLLSVIFISMLFLKVEDYEAEPDDNLL